MKKNNVNVENNTKVNNKVTVDPEITAYGIIGGFAVVVAGIASVHQKKLDGWKKTRYEKWVEAKNAYTKFPEVLKGVNVRYFNKAHDVFQTIVDRFYDAPLKRVADKQLGILDKFISELERSETPEKKASVIVEYAAMYKLPQCIDFNEKMNAYNRF